MAYTAIDKSTSFFNSVLWTGTGASQAVTGVGFSPDFVWGKKRSAAYFHGLFDTVRGATKYLQSDADAIEVTNAESLKTFDADGFTAGTIGVLNEVDATYVGWNWKAGTTSGLSGGDITPSAYSINTTSGVGIYKYTGNGSSTQTIAHGLGVIPKMVIIKGLDVITGNWAVYHEGAGNTKRLTLNTDALAATDADTWQDTTPTSTVFTIGSNSRVNTSGKAYIAYVFAEVKGFSAIGRYKGNYNADGPFIPTGFKPTFVMIKQENDTGDWIMFDSKRIGYNDAGVGNLYIEANNNGGAQSGYNFDMLSNGFKIRVTGGGHDLNGNQDPYDYIAFGQTAVSSTGVAATAR